ncbi:42118_t:CDS:2 [Gigaspora margarita]|uniref:42118_t:CDS:1 n=1 Tax=Gigaspora margarita TaxID=4874 RepID=A0ABN7UMY9_GIGMA|nr:42118_t:CDS:2 [Gigaspora margarita]
MDEIGQLTFKNYTDYLVTIMEETPTDHHITSHVNVLVNNNDNPAPSVTHKNNNELPSYFDVVKNNKQELNYITIHEEEGCEILPSYSCSVFKAGYVYKKDEMISQGVKAKRRTWRKFYFYLWGTLLRIYKNEPLDINCAVPIREFGMERAKINLAIDYTKRRNVLRVLLSTGYQFIFQVDCRNDCISWIENFQSSVNISSSIDDREMPMFITLPMRRQRGVNILPIIPNNVINEIGGSNLNNRNNCIYNSSFSEIVGDRYSLAITTTNGLIYEAFERITRELQQVQVDASPNQQLIW